MQIQAGNETLFRRVSHTMPAAITSVKKLFRRAGNIVLSGHEGGPSSQRAAAPAAQRPLQTADELAAQAMAVRLAMMACSKKETSPLANLAPLKSYIEKNYNNITYDKIEYLTQEREGHAEKHNFLRALITELYYFSTLENTDINNKKLAVEALQKEICGYPFKTFGNLNEQQHGTIFNTPEGTNEFKQKIISILDHLQAKWEHANERII